MEARTITANGETFTRTDYNGIAIVVRDTDGYVNATAIVRDSGSKTKREHFSRFMNGDRMAEICEYWKENQQESAENTTSPKTARWSGEPFYTINEGIPDESKDLRGTYIHPKLIHFVAEWVSIEYAFRVATIMDMIDERQHAKQIEALENYDEIVSELQEEIDAAHEKIEKQREKIRNQRGKIEQLTHRAVPDETSEDYIYMVYRDSTYPSTKMTMLKLIRRNKMSWRREFKEIQASEDCLFFEELLPTAMPVNHVIRKRIEDAIPREDCTVSGTTVMVKNELVDKVIEIVESVINTFRE